MYIDKHKGAIYNNKFKKSNDRVWQNRKKGQKVFNSYFKKSIFAIQRYFGLIGTRQKLCEKKVGKARIDYKQSYVRVTQFIFLLSFKKIPNDDAMKSVTLGIPTLHPQMLYSSRIFVPESLTGKNCQDSAPILKSEPDFITVLHPCLRPNRLSTKQLQPKQSVTCIMFSEVYTF